MATMSPKDFRRWRKTMDLSQKDAAEALGLKRRVVQYYEKGERDGESVDIPKYVRLACYALLQGVKDYKGPPKEDAEECAPVPESEPPVAAPAQPVQAESEPKPDQKAEPKPELVKGKPAKGRGKTAVRKGAGKPEDTAAVVPASAPVAEDVVPAATESV